MALSGSLSAQPNKYIGGKAYSETNTGSPIGKGATNTTYAAFGFTKSVPLSVYYGFDFSAVPASAEIETVTAKVKVLDYYAVGCTVSLCSGTTKKATSPAITSSQIVTLTFSGAFTRAELNDARLLFSGTTTTTSSRTLQFYGADITVAYTYQNKRFMLRLEPSNGGNSLPVGYTRLENIRCTGAQYADLGFKPNQNTRVVMDCQADSVDSGGSFPFGVRAGLNSKAFAVALVESQVFYNYASTYQFADFSGITERMTIDANKNVATFKGSATTTISLTTGTFTCDSNLLVGAFGDNGTPSVGASAWNGPIWSCQAYDNGTLIRDCYPCLNPSNVPGLYDIVNGVFYGSATSTPFVAGPEYNDVWHDVARTFKKVSGIWVEQTDLANVVDQTKRLVNGGEYVVELPEGYTRLEYIESTGSQYIDTEVSIGPSNAAGVSFATDKQYMGAGADGTAYGATPYFNSFYVGDLGSLYYGDGRVDVSTGKSVERTRKIFKYSGTGKISITGMDDIDFTFQDPETALNFLLFAYNQGTYGVSMHVARCWGHIMWQNNVMVRRYIPCADPNGVVGMYEAVEGKFKGSATSTPFVASPEYTPPATGPISFTIAGTSYQADSGMTWNEWVASSYNTAGYKIAFGNVMPSSGEATVKLNGAVVAVTDVIVSGGAYTH